MGLAGGDDNNNNRGDVPMPERLIPLARQRIGAGELPAVMAEKTFGAFSVGQTCALCLQPIDARAPEIEVVHREAAQVHLMHPACFAAWSTVVRELATDSA
jgi:hypothetical protein